MPLSLRTLALAPSSRPWQYLGSTEHSEPRGTSPNTSSNRYTSPCLTEIFSCERPLTSPLHPGSVMNLTPLASSILLGKRITIAFVLFRILRPTSFWSASALHHPRHSRTCARNGFPRFTITVPVFLASLSARRPIFATTRRSRTSWPSSVCSQSAKKMESVWRRILER